MAERDERPTPRTWRDQVILFCLEKKLAVFLVVGILAMVGVATAPFNWDIEGFYRSPVPVDAIPDIGENQQIVYTEWEGRSPQDIEDQVTYPLVVSLMGVPGVKTIRSSSAFGISNIYIVFRDDIEFYWSRTRILEKLGSLPRDLLPEGVFPKLGPDATAMGQVFWYTLEGLNRDGEAVGGFDPHELRSLQDWYVRYALLSVEGVAEVGSVGGFVQEYQVDVDPALLRAYDVTLEDVVSAVRRSNLDVGARTFEINKVEYLIRGLGFIQSVEDLETAVVKTRDNVPVFVGHIASVSLGPALRLGALDKNGREAVGGVVTTRYGENPLAVIERVKAKIEEISPGLPSRTLEDGTVSRVGVVPFYDRTALIKETLGTLNTALTSEILVSVVVILIMVMHLGSSLLISALLPLAVLATFIAMRGFGVEANIVALSGIAIAIGTMVDMAIILTENILRHLKEESGPRNRLKQVYAAASEVSGAILTAIATTVISFLPVFTMIAAEGKLFRPLAFTKTFALLASVVLALTVIPAAAHLFFRFGKGRSRTGLLTESLIYVGVAVAVFWDVAGGVFIALVGATHTASRFAPERLKPWLSRAGIWLAIAGVAVVLARHWTPLGPALGFWRNFIFTGLVLGVWIGFFRLVIVKYESILRWVLDHKRTFAALPLIVLLFGGTTWLGFDTVFGWLPAFMREAPAARHVARAFPGLSKEFMPALDEGSYLLMPSTMPHASIAEVLDIVRKQDRAIQAIPEVSMAVGKIGRADTPLDPAPLSMIETVINYHPEFISDEDGRPLRFAYDPDAVGYVTNRDGEPVVAPDGAAYLVRGVHERDGSGELVRDDDGAPFRLWRPALDPALNPGRESWKGIDAPQDIWDEIVRVSEMPGTTTPSMLQPISARLVMLQSGIRAAMAVEVKGPDLASIQQASDAIEGLLRDVEAISPSTVVADRIVAKPYLEIEIDRKKAAQYGLDVQAVQEVIETALGGKAITTTVEGRERYPVRVRYMRELRDDFTSLAAILVATPEGVQVPLGQVAEFRYTPGPSVIKTEDSFLVGYVLFDKKRDYTEVDAVEQARAYLGSMAEAGFLELPAGVSYSFTGAYENQVRAEKRLMFILPLTLALILIILYLQFGRISTSMLVFSGVAVAWAGGFVMIWLFAQPWFFDLSLFGVNMRDLFQMHGINMSIPVWVGFLALFGIATDDGVVMASYLDERFSVLKPQTRAQVRDAVVEAGMMRIRPCMMTTATTILALIPVLTSTGRGSDLMVPMAIPTFGGMAFAVITIFVVPAAYCWLRERELGKGDEDEG